METYGIGTDIIEISRFEAVSDRFMQRCFTEQEQEKLKNRALEATAGYFAAKEAVAKALGTGFTGFRPSDIEVIHNNAGKPEIILHGGAKEIAESAGIKKILISISHCKTYAAATAMAQS